MFTGEQKESKYILLSNYLELTHFKKSFPSYLNMAPTFLDLSMIYRSTELQDRNRPKFGSHD